MSQQNREDRGQIGATNNSIPRPSPTPQVYQPAELPGAFAIELHKKVTILSNRLDILILRPSPTPQVYDPGPWPRIGFENHVIKSISNINNRLDLITMRINFLEETISGILDHDNIDQGLVEWFKTNREKLQRLSRQQEQHQQRF